MEMAAYTVSQDGRHGLITLQGDLTAIVIPDLQSDLKKMIAGSVRELTFDLSSSKMVDSSGIGLLIAAANSLTPQGGTIRVTNVAPEIVHLFQSMRLTGRLNVNSKA